LAAKAEGHLNVITLPSNWANYGAIMKDFTAKYGIKITDENLSGDVAVKVDLPSTEAALMLPGTSVEVSLAGTPVLMAERR
jgi:putative spermidine/putrescine transport system substrate-binding protein